MDKIALFLRISLYGAAYFWLPDIAFHAIFQDLGQTQVVMMTGVQLLSLCLGVLILMNSHSRQAVWVPVAVLAGIWLTAGAAMGTSGLFTGAGFLVPNGWTLLFTGMLPPVAYLMSSYDGSFWALVLGSLGLLTLWVRMQFHI